MLFFSFFKSVEGRSPDGRAHCIPVEGGDVVPFWIYFKGIQTEFSLRVGTSERKRKNKENVKVSDQMKERKRKLERRASER